MARSAAGKSPKTYESVGTTYDGIRVLKPRSKATHFTAAEVKSAIAKAMQELVASKEVSAAGRGNIFIEPHPDGGYAVKCPNAKRASASRSEARRPS